ncbi:MAG: AbrB/MazE/SpoVT family DNA-binding domain-containing protein [Elusimicrobiota bacterium]
MRAKEVLLGKRNQVTIPKIFLPDGVSLFSCEKMDDGAIVLRPRISIPAHQNYYWTAKWQQGERKASEDIRRGRVRRHSSAAKLAKALRLDGK